MRDGKKRIDGTRGDPDEWREAKMCAMRDIGKENIENGCFAGNGRSYVISCAYIGMNPKTFKDHLPHIEIITI